MTINRVDPRVRAYGKARIDITRRAKDEQEWQDRWKEPRYPFPFTWGASWKQSVQYFVDDFAAEVGFLMDVLGLPACAFSPSSAMFTSPDQAFSFSVAAVPEGCPSTPPETLRIQFMVQDILRTQQELERRGVVFEEAPHLNGAGAGLYSGYFRTPHGICVDLIGSGEDKARQQPTAFQSLGEEAPRDLDRLQEIEEHPEDQTSLVEEILSGGEASSNAEMSPSSGDSFFSGPDPSADSQPDASIMPADPPLEFGELAGNGDEKGEEPGSSKVGMKPQAAPNLRPDSFHGVDLRQRASNLFPHTSGVRHNGGLRGPGNRKQTDPFHPGSSLRRSPAGRIGIPPLPEAPPRPGNKEAPSPEPGSRLSPDPLKEKGEEPKQASLFPDSPAIDKEHEIKYEDIEESSNGEDLDDFIA